MSSTPTIVRPKPIDASGVSFEQVDLTLALAEELLDANPDNRRVSEDEVDRHVRNLLADRWIFNGDTYRIDRNGKFIDGQHRLIAFVRVCLMLIADGQEPFVMPIFLVRGLPPKAKQTIDIGRPRTLADELYMRGMKDTGHVATWVRHVWNYITYDGDLRAAAGRGRGTPSIPELLELFDTQLAPHAARITARGRIVGDGARIPVSCAMLIVWVLEQLKTTPAGDEGNEDDVDFFLDRLATGNGVGEEGPTSAIYALRRMIHNKRKPTGKGNRGQARYASWMWIAWVFTAWKHFSNGQEVEQIKFTAGGAYPTEYPLPLDPEQGLDEDLEQGRLY